MVVSYKPAVNWLKENYKLYFNVQLKICLENNIEAVNTIRK